ncbi:PREDICTED: caveolin-1-like [Priapulus caudatus]|uniref:Caveolin n=1 Tax=Priapulus caudatus TaxID=37621 RepID=A0ABM1DXR7_PRICU|nr:PREDICTED: caveolin-1-like [Priapulus caudatus]
MMTEETAQSTTPIFEKPHVTNVDDGAEEGEKKTQKNASKWTVKGEEPKSWPLGDTVLDIHERDPNMINQYAKTLFGDIFAEPEPTTFSFDAIWRLSFTVFTVSEGVVIYRYSGALSTPAGGRVWLGILLAMHVP